MMQDDKKLREALEKLEVPEFVVWLDDELKVTTKHLTEKTVDQILALFHSAQHQLLEELIAEKGYYVATQSRAAVVNSELAVPVSVIEHKKQELERGK